MLKQKLIISLIKRYNPTADKWDLVGYRFFDLQTKVIEDFDVRDKNFLKYLIQNKNNIENGTWDSARMTGYPKIKFINGRENRYPVLNADTGALVGNNPLVIAAEFRDGYLVVGPFGETFEWTKEQAAAYARLNGIANGAYKTNSKKGYISAISQEYAFIDRNIITPEQVAKKNALEKAKREKEQKLREDLKSKFNTVKETAKAEKESTVKKEESVVEEEPVEEVTQQDKKAEQPLADVKTDAEQIPAEMMAEVPVEEEVVQPSVEQSIMDEADEEKAQDGLTEEEVADVLSTVEPVTEAQTQKFSDDFYKLLEPTFGGKKSVDILKYMIEERNYSIDSVYKLIDEGKEENKYVPTLIGLLAIYTDKIYNRVDKKLHDLCVEAIDPSVLKIEQDLMKKDIEFNEVWDASIIAPKRVHDTTHYAFPLSLLEERLANYAATTGRTLYGCTIEKDGTTYYNGVEVKVPGYTISGINPSYITITNAEGKTKKVKKK
jgi:hypothetical protein